MKKITLVAFALAPALVVPAVSMAGVTGNIGFATDYVFRGIQQAASSAYAGADYAGDNGIYAGTWWADVGTGTETDVYFGWAGGGDNLTFKVGYTGYRYLDDFDGDYDEVNLGLYAGIFALDVAVGTYDSDLVWGLGNQDYVFTSVTLTPEKGPYYKLGLWSGDFADNILPLATRTGKDTGEYLEVGYSYTMEEPGVVLSAALIYSQDLPVNSNLTGDYTLTFGIKKNFEMK